MVKIFEILVASFWKGGTISSKDPHYAFLNSNNCITWVSDSHIYLEAICDKNKGINEERSVITGGHYKKDTEKLSFDENFQAV